MSKWKINKLIDVARVIRGVTFDKGDVSDLPSEGFVPILRAGNIGDKLDTKNDLVYVPAYKVGKDQLLQVGDVAICMSSGSSDIVGKTSKLEEKWNGSVGAFCAIIRFNQDVLPKFGAIYFQSRAFISWRKHQAEGANIKNIRKSDLESLMLPVPPLSEQERIVCILDETEEIKQLRTRANNRTADLIPALFNEMFGDPVKNEKRWKIKNIEDVCAKVTDGTHDTPEYILEGIPLVTSKNVANGKIDFSTAQFISIEDHRQIIKRSHAEPGDVLFGMIGTIGNTAIVPEEKTFSIKNVALFKKSEKVTSKYLHSFLSHNAFQKTLLADSRGGTQQFVGLGTLRSISIPLPPITLQQEFDAKVDEIHLLEMEQSSSEQKLESLFQSLLHRAFEGEL